MKFLIRADASPQIGMGHVMRCIALGQILKDAKNEVIFLTQTKNDSIIKRIRYEKFKVITMNKKKNILTDAKETIKQGKKYNVEWIITDGYKFTTAYQKEIKKNGFKLMCIDDTAQCHYVSDIVLNQNLNAEKIFKYSCEPYTKLLLGIKYVLLRKEYRKLNNYNRVINNSVKKVLITMGGSDPDNFTLKVVNFLNEIKYCNLKVKVIIGPEYKIERDLKFALKNSSHKLELVKFRNNIIPLIKWCDLAISSASSTVWELLMLKTPTLLISLDRNQNSMFIELRREKCILPLNINNGEIILPNNSKDIFLLKRERKLLYKNIFKLVNFKPQYLLEEII